MTSKWTKRFRDLSKKGGKTKDFKDLYFKMKSSAVPIDFAPFELQKILGRLEEKKGGLVRKGRPKLTKKGWK